MANRIILKRNVGVTGPTGGQLVPGEPAIAMDGPTGANSKLYVGIADTVTGSVDNVVAIGGGYYTIFVDDIYSKKSIIQGTEQSFTTALRSKITGNEAAIAAITGAYVTGGNVSQFANDAGYLSTHDHNTVDSFNGATGAVIGVSSVAGLTGTPNASAVRTAIDVDEIYTKKSIIQATTDSFTTGLHSDITGNTAAIAAITGAYVTGGNVSQFANDTGYLTSSTGLVKSNNLSDVTASTARTNLDLDEIYTKKSIIEGTEQSFTTTLKNKLDAIEASADVTDVANVKAAGALIGTTHDNYVISVNGSTGSVSAATGGGNISQFSNDSSYLTGFTVTTQANGGSSADFSIIDDENGNPPVSPRINELTFEAGTGINLYLYKITGDAGGGNPANTAGAKIHIQNGLGDTAFLKSGGVTQTNTNPIIHVGGLISILGAEVDIGALAFVEFSSTGKVTGNLPVDGDGVFGGIIESAGVSGTGRITGSNIPSGTILSSTLGSAVDGNDQTVSKVALKDYGETIHYNGTSSSPSLNFENGNVQHLTGSSGIAAGTAITLSNPPPNGVAGTMTVICINCGLIPYASTFWPTTINWPGGIEPTLSSSGTDIFSVMTHDGGATYYGFMGGMQFS